jgi:hypothetical protein
MEERVSEIKDELEIDPTSPQRLSAVGGQGEEEFGSQGISRQQCTAARLRPLLPLHTHDRATRT